MRTTPEQQAKLRARLREAVAKAGSAEKLGKALGWANGGYVRQAIREVNPRTVTDEFIHRATEAKDENFAWLRKWFDGIVTPIVQTDMTEARVARAAKAAWPFRRLSIDLWQDLGPEGRAIVEDAAVTKARELLSERAQGKRQLTA